MTVTFFGHRDAPSTIRGKLKDILVELIEKEDATTFYVGNQGNFDSTVLSVLNELSKKYPHIDYAVMLAYFPTEKDNFGDITTIYPEGLEGTPPRFAISKRNKIMLSKADTVVAYVLGAGGAKNFLDAAKRAKKRTVNLAEK